MSRALTRREFLKLSTLSACSLAILPPEPVEERELLGLGRVTVSWIYLYDEPSYNAKRLHRLERDTLVTLLGRETPDDGPPHNPLWYRVPNGFVHSGYIQRVRWKPQTPRLEIAEGGALFEVSIPFTRSYRKPDQSSDPLYRLYYQSTAWVEAAEQGADG